MISNGTADLQMPTPDSIIKTLEKAIKTNSDTTHRTLAPNLPSSALPQFYRLLSTKPKSPAFNRLLALYTYFTESHPEIHETVLNDLLPCFKAQDKAIRYAALQMLQPVVAQAEEYDDDVLESLVAGLIARSFDKDTQIRLIATTLLVIFQVYMA